MIECMGTDKPLVSIVMAVYNPNMDWLKEQLISLNEQKYMNLELIIFDDCSPDIPYEALKDCVAECITRFPYELFRNEKNLGSTATFEKLTMMANGKYIAYCDQDDIWDEGKIGKLLSCFTNKSVVLAYSDARIINESGEQISDSISKFRPRHVFYDGKNLTGKLLTQNFVVGCTMIIRRETVSAMFPFASELVHDHYIAIMASQCGEFALLREPLMSYRIHKTNQTNTLTGIHNKNEYCRDKIDKYYRRLLQLAEKERISELPEYNQLKQWAGARASYCRGNLSAAKIVWKYRGFDKMLSCFELIMMKLPDWIFVIALKMIKEGNAK